LSITLAVPDVEELAGQNEQVVMVHRHELDSNQRVIVAMHGRLR